LPEQYGKFDQLNLKLQKMIRTVEDIVTFAQEQKVEDPLAFLKMNFVPDFDTTTLPQRVRQLSEARVEDAIANVDFFYQTGLRFSDYSSIGPEDIRNGMLYKKQGKSDHWVVIPLRSTAYDIIVNCFKSNIPKTTNEELNRHIKKIGQLAGINIHIKASYKKGNQDIVVTKPKYAWITSHTCRRSFCTNEFLAGTPPELIMKISGHKSIKDFYKYIRISPEQAGKQIREIWEKRGEMGCMNTK